uniref:RNA-directed RNA polymerase n=1 Tax=Citrus psorosis virus TaxID=73561 RepID=A0A4Y5QZK7_9VIRU|nr:RdRp protein [Citrus psorosis virus]
MEWSDEKASSKITMEDEIEVITSDIVTSEDNNKELAKKEEELKKAQEARKNYEEEYDKLMEEMQHYPSAFKVLSGKKEEYIMLRTAQEHEKSLEPKKDPMNYTSMIKYWTKWDHSRYIGTYVDRPALISRLDSPYKIIPSDTVEDFVYREDYPEKFGVRSKIDLFRLREFIGKDKWNLKIKQGIQKETEIWVSLLKETKNKSKKLETLLEYGKNMADEELLSNREKITGKMQKTYKEVWKIEPSENTQISLWFINLLEIIIFKIKMTYSQLLNKVESISESIEREGRKIITKVNLDGSSTTELIIKSAVTNEVINTKIFISNTFHAIKYDDVLLIGDNTLLKFVLSIEENELNMNIVKDYNFMKGERDDNLFIDFMMKLKKVPQPLRTSIAATYETVCLMMADQKCASSTLPIIDAVIELMKLDKTIGEELLSICMISDGATCIRASTLAKMNTYAEVNELEGLKKYIQRTNRNHEVSKESVERLRCMMRMKVITNYIKKFGVVPQITCNSGLLEQELNLMASGGSYNNHIIRNTSYYKDVKLGKMLQPGNEVNISSRVIDKACTKDEYDFSGNSVKELVYYITKNDLVDLIDEIEIGKVYEENKNKDRETKCLFRKDKELANMRKYKICRLVEKEKELKTEGRFYGVASFKLKIYISIIMEMIKRAMKLIPGQMMTMSEDERRTVMHRMSVMLEEKDAYTLFLDYSGHNTSQRPENNLFILEEIADMYGFEENSLERQRLTQVVYLFNELEILYEHLFSDMVVWSKRQKGAIEGWFGPLWGIQSQLMLDDMMVSMGIEKYIGTTYSDDSCGVFVKKNLDQEELDRMIEYIQNYSLKMGLLVKLSQTQITNGRCSMLKNHYYFDKPIDTSYKRIMSISPNSDILWGNDSERVSVIDSAYTSSVLRADDNYIQTVIRNFRIMIEIEKDVIRWALFYDLELDPRFINLKGSLSTLGKIYRKKIEEASELKELKEIENSMPSEDEVVTQFFLFHIKDRKLLKLTLALMYLPSTCYGHALTSMVDSFISGYSYSNVKRLSYVESLFTEKKDKVFIYSLVKLSENAISYVGEPFPMIGGRYDTKTILKDELKKLLKNKVQNNELKEMLNSFSEDKENLFKAVIVHTFERCFSHRIASKFYECSIFNYINELYAKINNSTTMSYLVGKKKMNQLWNKAWKVNHKLEYKLQGNIIEEIKGDPSYFGLVLGRDKVDKKIVQNSEIKYFNMSFLNIEELPIIGKLSVDNLTGPLRCIIKPMRVYSKIKGLRLPGPVRTAINTTKFDRDLEIEGMFQNKLIFMAYELVRYIKWIIFDMEKYNKQDNSEAIQSLRKLTDITIGTFSDARIEDIEEAVVCPKGGRYFHRALSGGFNPKTGDLSSNMLSSRVEVTGLDRLTDETGGVDNNINLQLVITALKVKLSLIGYTNNETIAIGLDSDVRYFAKDVTFALKNIKHKSELDCELGLSHKFDSMTLDKLNEKRTLYHNFSYFVSVNEDIAGKFIDHKTVLPSSKIEEISSFQSLNKYMQDMEILVPTQIPENIMKELVPNLNSYGSIERYLEEFYKFYKGLNIIGNESFTKAVVRSIINQELFDRKNVDGKDWLKEIEMTGFSYGYRKTLLKIFIVSCCMVFRVEEPKGNTLKITIFEDKTKINCLNNIKRIKNQEAHLHINDKRISDLINMAFPLVGYQLKDVFIAVREIMNEHNGKIIDGTKVIQYFNVENVSYVDQLEEKNCGNISYSSIVLKPSDLSDEKQFIASIKAFEMIATLNCKPQHVSSPTKSDVYPSAKALLEYLMNNNIIKQDSKIADIFAGRGDFHLIMDNMGLEHTSISRNDGYNLINRIPGMKEIKANIDMTYSENYGQYLDHDVFILDISHFTGDPNNIIRMIDDIVSVGRKAVIRWNSIAPMCTKLLYNFVIKRHHKIDILMPTIESPGYIYLLFNGEFYKSKEISNGENSKKEKKTYNENIITSNMVLELNRIRKTSILNCSGVKVSDHTQELISDDKLVSILEENENKAYISNDIEMRIEDGEKLEELLMILNPSKEIMEMDNTIKQEIKVEESERGARSLKYFKRLIHETKSKLGVKHIKLNRRFMNWMIKENKINVDNGKLTIIEGVKNGPCNEVIRTINKIIDDSHVSRLNLEAWTCVKTGVEQFMSVEETEAECDMKIILMMIQGSTEYKSRFFSYDRILRLAYIASDAIKTGTMAESILVLSGLRSGVLSSLKKNKGKALRYDCLNIKLIMNRMLVLSEERNIILQASNLRLSEMVKDILLFRKIGQGDKRVKKSIRGKFKKGNQSSKHIISWFDEDEELELECTELIEQREIEEEILKLREFERLEDYLESQGINELFSAITDELSKEGVRMEMTEEHLTQGIDNQVGILSEGFKNFLGVKDDEVEKNRKMTIEEMKELVEDEDEYEYISDED